MYREDYSIPNKPVESAKNWFVILFKVDTTYIQFTLHFELNIIFCTGKFTRTFKKQAPDIEFDSK